MLRLFGLPTVFLVAGIGYGAVLMAADMPYIATAPGDVALNTWASDTGSVSATAGVSCALLPDHACQFRALDGIAISSRTQVLDDTPRPDFNPYSGTFVSFPLR